MEPTVNLSQYGYGYNDLCYCSEGGTQDDPPSRWNLCDPQGKWHTRRAKEHGSLAVLQLFASESQALPIAGLLELRFYGVDGLMVLDGTRDRVACQRLDEDRIYSASFHGTYGTVRTARSGPRGPACQVSTLSPAGYGWWRIMVMAMMITMMVWCGCQLHDEILRMATT